MTTLTQALGFSESFCHDCHRLVIVNEGEIISLEKQHTSASFGLILTLHFTIGTKGLY